MHPMYPFSSLSERPRFCRFSSHKYRPMQDLSGHPFMSGMPLLADQDAHKMSKTFLRRSHAVDTPVLLGAVGVSSVRLPQVVESTKEHNVV